MKKLSWIAFALLAVVGIRHLVNSDSSPKTPSVPSVEVSPTAPAAPPTPVASSPDPLPTAITATNPVPVTSTIEPSALQRLERILQASQSLKEEELRAITEKTGDTPKALREFSAEMAEQMMDVWNQPNTQGQAFSQLAACSANPTLASPVRALCAANAKRLYLNSPKQFESRIQELEKNLTPDVREFLGQVKQVR